jgi:EpsI family protein
MNRVLWRRFLLCAAVLLVCLPIPDVVARQGRTPLRKPLDSVEYHIDGWRGRDQHLDGAVRRRLGTDEVLLREYVNGGPAPVWLYVSYFGRQRQGEASHSPRHCLPGAGWRPVRERRLAYPGPEGGVINEMVFAHGEDRQLVYYWYRERDRIVASEYLVKLYLVVDAIARQRTDGALVRISTPIDGSEEAARARALDFMARIVPRIHAHLPE